MHFHSLSDYVIVSDGHFDIEADGVATHTPPIFSFPATALLQERAILAFRVESVKSRSPLRLRVEINDVEVLHVDMHENREVHYQTINEVVQSEHDGQKILTASNNSATFTALHGQQKVRVSDVVIWFQRESALPPSQRVGVINALEEDRASGAWRTVEFSPPFETDNVIVIPMTQTFNDSDTPGIRLRNVGKSSFEIRFEEAAITNPGAGLSVRSDGDHLPEKVGWVAYEIE